MYGALTGLSKRMVAQRDGVDTLQKWRRGYAHRPPPISSFSASYPGTCYIVTWLLSAVLSCRFSSCLNLTPSYSIPLHSYWILPYLSKVMTIATSPMCKTFATRCSSPSSALWEAGGWSCTESSPRQRAWRCVLSPIRASHTALNLCPLTLARITAHHHTARCHATQQCNLMQCNTTQYNTIQYNAIQHNTIQYNTIQYNAIQYNTIQNNTIQYTTIQCNTKQYNTVQYNTIQYNNLLYMSNNCYTIAALRYSSSSSSPSVCSFSGLHGAHHSLLHRYHRAEQHIAGQERAHRLLWERHTRPAHAPLRGTGSWILDF